MQRKPLRAGAAMLALTAIASVAPGTTAPAQETEPRPSLNLYGVTGLIVPFVGIKLIDLALVLFGLA